MGSNNDGLIQRLQLAVWPDPVKHWKWVDQHPDRSAGEAYETVFMRLHEDALGSTENPTVYRFSVTVQNMFREFIENLYAEIRNGQLSDIMQSHLMKIPTTAVRLALVFELIEGGQFEVGEKATSMALAWASYLRGHASRIYAAGALMIEDAARLILERRHQLPPQFSVRDVQRKNWAGLVERDVVVAAIEQPVTTNHCREINKPTGPGGGRPTESFSWHPELAK